LEHNGSGIFKNLGGIKANLGVEFVVNIFHHQCMCTPDLLLVRM